MSYLVVEVTFHLHIVEHDPVVQPLDRGLALLVKRVLAHEHVFEAARIQHARTAQPRVELEPKHKEDGSETAITRKEEKGTVGWNTGNYQKPSTSAGGLGCLRVAIC